MGDDGGRVYGGRSGPERRAERRARLVAAGLELFGTEGWAGAPIERLCTTAGVATRSFYEEFAGREQLLLAVYDAVLEGAAQAVLDAVEEVEAGRAASAGSEADPAAAAEARLRAGVAAYVGHLTADPRRARVVNREVRTAGGAPGVQEHRRATVTRFAEMIERDLRVSRRAQDPYARHVLALALAGAVNEVLGDWVCAPVPRPPVEPIVHELTRLYVAGMEQREPGGA